MRRTGVIKRHTTTIRLKERRVLQLIKQREERAARMARIRELQR